MVLIDIYSHAELRSVPARHLRRVRCSARASQRPRQIADVLPDGTGHRLHDPRRRPDQKAFRSAHPVQHHRLHDLRVIHVGLLLVECDQF